MPGPALQRLAGLGGSVYNREPLDPSVDAPSAVVSLLHSLSGLSFSFLV